MSTIASSFNRENLLRRFRDHLLSTQGLAFRTCTARVFYVREFLQAHARGRGKIKLRELTPEICLNYVLERSRRDSPSRLQSVASALRSFGRFLRLSGHNHLDLASALPRIASPGRSGLPDYLRAEQLKHLLESIDIRTASGLRNYAIMLCLARLGLRASDVAQLTLDQIQWRRAVIVFGPGKCRRERQLPLSQELGAAIAAYLQQRKIPPDSRRVFGAIRTGQTLSSTAISQMVSRALKHAGIQTPRPGAHLLRRTLASHLVQHRVSLKAVADLLGHSCLDTTRIYTNVNHAMLAEVSRPWPTEVTP